MLTFLLLLLMVAARAAEPSWQRMPAEEFARLAVVNAQINFAHYDRGLMAAAIFHETNRARMKLGLTPFRHLVKLDEAADLQASTGALLPGLSHQNPFPALADVTDRVQSVGLAYLQVAENIALTMTLDSDPVSASVIVHQADAAREFLDAQTGRRLEQMTYAGFAAVVVRQWMNSPGHRANILDRELRCLGCSARWRKDYTGVDLLYSVQVFFTPAPESVTTVNPDQLRPPR